MRTDKAKVDQEIAEYLGADRAAITEALIPAIGKPDYELPEWVRAKLDSMPEDLRGAFLGGLVYEHSIKPAFASVGIVEVR